MKYQLDEELQILEKLKMPANVKLLPAFNMLLRNFKCKSDENVNVSEYKINSYDKEEINISVIEPKNTDEILPCIVFFHGGGFMLRASFSHYHLAKDYAIKLQCKVICVDYRLALEFPFPTPVEDCFSAYEWVIEHTHELKIDKEKIIIAGDSAGGNLSISVTLMARDRKKKMPIGTLLIYPVTDRRMITDSMQKYTDTPIWDANLNKMMWNAYLGEQEPQPVEYASPLEAKSLKGFPATYIEVAEIDCLHDEGVLFYDRLKEEGVNVELHEIKRACHGFETLLESNITKQCLERRIKWMKALIKGEIKNEE